MVEHGATTIWELWNANTAAPVMNSQNHVMLLGDLIIWYYENLAGIKSGRENPGFKKIIMKPSFFNELDFVNASYNSVHGKIISYWTRTEDSIEWLVTIPPNTSAQVYIPVDKPDLIEEDGKELKNSPGVNNIQSERKHQMLEIGSGSYNFKFKSN
jgi:alpha-L-rhamnosidase